MTEFDNAFQKLIERQSKGEITHLSVGNSEYMKCIYYEEPHQGWVGGNRVEFDKAGLLTGHYMYVQRV